MRVIAIFYLITVLFLHFIPTTQWAKFSYVSRTRIRDYNQSVAACQLKICNAVLNAKKIKSRRPDACNQITEAYGGTGKYYNRQFQYFEVYSIVKTSYKNYQYIGDCVCSNSQCTVIREFCVYTYWFGFRYIWNNQMC
uniref:SCP domain-containing protein n=1 Tax=Strongyloides papillosus TaxID=174720 RepID=A0A0N5BKA6_STREA